MIKVAIMGTGNVARHLFDVFVLHDDIEVVEVAGRNSRSLEYFGKKTDKTTLAKKFSKKADLYILAVSDDGLSQLSKSLKDIDGLLVHTSGSISIDVLPKSVRRGIFYPLQSFSKNIIVDFSAIPICIEAENEADTKLLNRLASKISDHVVIIDSVKRSMLHLAAVFVNNFTNHFYHIGQQICQENGLPFNLLLPLIQETAHKIGTTSPIDAQTGPARRNDETTITRHLDLLKNPEYRKIYQTLTKSIQKTYG